LFYFYIMFEVWCLPFPLLWYPKSAVACSSLLILTTATPFCSLHLAPPALANVPCCGSRNSLLAIRFAEFRPRPLAQVAYSAPGGAPIAPHAGRCGCVFYEISVSKHWRL